MQYADEVAWCVAKSLSAARSTVFGLYRALTVILLPCAPKRAAKNILLLFWRQYQSTTTFYLATVPPILHVERIHKEDYSCSVNFSVQFKPTEVTQEVINLGLSSLLVHFAPMSSSGVPSFYHEKVSAVRAPRHQRSRIWCTQGAFQPVALFYVDFVQGTNCEEKNLPPTFEIQRNSSLCVIFLRVFFFCDGTSIRERTLIYLPHLGQRRTCSRTIASPTAPPGQTAMGTF